MPSEYIKEDHPMNLCAIGTGAITKSMLAEFNRSEVLHVTAI